MRKPFSSFILIGLLAAAAPLAQAAGGGKIGVLDWQKVLALSSAGKEVQSEMQAYVGKQQQWVKDQQAKLQKEQDDLTKNKSVLGQDAQQKQESQLQQDYQAYQQEGQKRQQDTQRYQQSLLEPLQAKLEDVVQKYAKDNGYDLILDKSAVVYSGDNAPDITDAILKAFNAAQPHAPAPSTGSQ